MMALEVLGAVVGESSVWSMAFGSQLWLKNEYSGFITICLSDVLSIVWRAYWKGGLPHRLQNPRIIIVREYVDAKLL
jgi:hypothetical protein